MAIGGAVDFEEPTIFKEFIKRAGGARARIVVLPQASGLANTGNEYCETFQGLGLKSKPISLEFRERKEANKKKHLEALRDASGIFITGGTQMRLTSIFGGTTFESESLSAFKRGAGVAGTSAGTAVMSKVMSAYGKGGATPRERIAQFSPGLGFTDKSFSISTFGSETVRDSSRMRSQCIRVCSAWAWMRIRAPLWKTKSVSLFAGKTLSRLWMEQR